MNKLIKDGEVAVIVSPGFGAGWSTWGERESCFDGELAQAILDGESGSEIAAKNWPDQYGGGLHAAVVCWVPLGTVFEIVEYDGAESIVFVADKQYLVA